MHSNHGCMSKYGRLTCIIFLLFWQSSVAQNTANDQSVQMRLEIELEEPVCTVRQNFTLRVRMTNPNDFTVTVRGFEMGYVEPEIHLLLDDVKTVRLRYGAMDSAWTGEPIRIEPGGVLEHRRFLYPYFEWDRWPIEPGSFELRGETHLSQAKIGFREEAIPIVWEYPAIMVQVKAQSALDRNATSFLNENIQFYREASNSVGHKAPSLPRVKLFMDFLDQFGNTAYAPEIRWEAAKLLRRALGNRAVPQDEVKQMVEFFDECLTFCLEKGGAYSEEFLKWDADGGGNETLELAFMHQRARLFKYLAEEIDRKNPDDAEAILYRRVIVVGMTESIKKAQEEARTLRGRFPNGRCVQHLDGTLRELERMSAKLRPTTTLTQP